MDAAWCWRTARHESRRSLSIMGVIGSSTRYLEGRHHVGVATDGSRNSHWLQKALIQAWAGEDGRIACLKLGLGHVRHYAPKQAASERGFYDVGLPVDEAEIERRFQSVEDRGLPRLRTLANGSPTYDLQRYRPRADRHLLRHVDHPVQGWRNVLLRREHANEDQYVADFVASGVYTEAEAREAVRKGTTDTISQSFNTHTNKMAEGLLNCSWSLIRAAHGRFVVGDRHGVIIDCGGGGGGYTRLSHLLPIAPTAVIGFDPTKQSITAAIANGGDGVPNALSDIDLSTLPSADGQIHEAMADQRLIRDMNLCAIAQSDELVFGHDAAYLDSMFKRSQRCGSSGDRLGQRRRGVVPWRRAVRLKTRAVDGDTQGGSV